MAKAELTVEDRAEGVNLVRNGRVVRRLRGDVYTKKGADRDKAIEAARNEVDGGASDGNDNPSAEDVIKRWSALQEKPAQYFVQEFEGEDGQHQVALIDKETGSITAQAAGETSSALKKLYDRAGEWLIDDGVAPEGGPVQTVLGDRQMGPFGYAGVEVEGVDSAQVKEANQAQEMFTTEEPAGRTPNADSAKRPDRTQ